MICANCPKKCEDCLSVSCTCQHGGSAVRSLTHRERQEFVNGDRSTFLLPAAAPYVAPVPKAVISIRTTSNGSAP